MSKRLQYTVDPSSEISAIDPYWHFEHGYLEGYDPEDRRFDLIEVDGKDVHNLNKEDKELTVEVHAVSQANHPDDEVYYYPGPLTEAADKPLDSWQEEKRLRPLDAREGKQTLAYSLSPFGPADVTCSVRHTMSSLMDPSISTRRRRVVRAPVYRYEATFPRPVTGGMAGGNAIDDLSQATIVRRCGPYPLSEWGEWRDQLSVFYWVMFKIISIIRLGVLQGPSLAGILQSSTAEGVTGGFFRVIAIKGTQIVVKTVGDAAYVGTLREADGKIRSGTTNFMSSKHIPWKKLPEFFGGRSLYADFHLWKLYRYRWDSRDKTYVREKTLKLAACTLGLGRAGEAYTPILTRWNVMTTGWDTMTDKALAAFAPASQSEMVADVMSRVQFDKWLAPYQYTVLPRDGKKMNGSMDYHGGGMDHGAGLLFPRLGGLPSQPGDLGLHGNV